MNNIFRLIGRYVLFALLLFLVFSCRNVFASIDSITSENLKIEGDRISIQVEGMELGELLKVIKKKTGIEFELDKSLLGKKITVDFKELTLLEGIKKTIYPLNYAILYDSRGVVRKIIIIDQGTRMEDKRGADIIVQAPPGSNVSMQSQPDSKAYSIYGPPGTIAPVQDTPDSERNLTDGPPDYDVDITIAPQDADGFNNRGNQPSPPDALQDSDTKPKEVNAPPGE